MLLLYKKEGCPFCEKVVKFLEKNFIEYKPKDILNIANKEELIRLGGKEQVPFLVDTTNNKMMYESDEIIEYLKKLKS